MLEQMECTWTWIDVKLNQRIGQRGAEMVEYAIILACIAVLAAWFYSTDNPSNNPNDASKQKTMVNILTRIWTGIRTKLNGIL